MLLSNQVVFDDFVSDWTEVYTAAKYNDSLGYADKLMFHVRASQVANITSPTLTLKVYSSCDGKSWVLKNTVINAQSVSASAETLLSGYDLGNTPSGGFVRLGVTMGGSGGTPQGMVRVTVAGRGQQL